MCRVSRRVSQIQDLLVAGHPFYRCVTWGKLGKIAFPRQMQQHGMVGNQTCDLLISSPTRLPLWHATPVNDSRRVLLFETLQPGETINAARYCQTSDKLRQAIRRKRPGQLTNGVILQHDNAKPHTARVTQGWLVNFRLEILPHPPHRPDLAPSDFYLFGPLKRELVGKRFDDDEELVDHVRKWLQNLDGSFFREGIYSMVRRWQKCVDRLGCYVKK
ncbi:histone-lysine N-methyltransferase SETMAR [Elysia marginata]|uniref:Histone-lysine N-methyltransferase SETMAR n=1 Tax=Elysia marginata TaxID=1093978 RepID=A0AAV4EE79_9GAST|nr:histone-lysine N-methyltransferase SETMAR [Elysia marginata]